MGKYLVRRMLWMVVVLFFVSLITFLLAYAVPGDPAKTVAGTHATPEVLPRIRDELGLDKPLYEQYGLYLWHLVHGNMATATRPSCRSRRPSCSGSRRP